MRVRMSDTTATADTGALVQGNVYDLDDTLGQHLVDIGVAVKSTAKQTTAQVNAEAAGEQPAPQADEEPAPQQQQAQPGIVDQPQQPQPQPSIDDQAADAGTKPADQGTDVQQPQPINPPSKAPKTA